jgi:hypothetical protein
MQRGLRALPALLALLARRAAADWASGSPNTDRPGLLAQELLGSPAAAPSAAACFALCNATWGCASWVFTPNATADCPGGHTNSTPLPREPTCSLKYAVGMANFSNCSTAGFPEQRLAPAAHAPAPTGSVAPAGWLRAQMQLVADGFVGNLQNFFAEVQNSSWIGGNSDGGSSYERAAYWIQGACPLAHALGDARVLGDVQRYIEYALAHAGTQPGEDLGWLGPDGSRGDARMYWGKYPFLRALSLHFEATGDARLPAAMQAHLREMGRRMMPWSGYGGGQGLGVQWSASRVHDLALSVIFLLELCEAGRAAELALDAGFLFDFADRIHSLSRNFDYEAFFASRDRFPLGAVANPYAGSTNDRMFLHGVDFAQALKSGAVWYRLFGDEAALASSFSRVRRVERFQGFPSGEICGDEHLCGNMPSQATELCAIVEGVGSYAFNALTTGDVFFYERLELLALNALPASFTKNQWGHPYLHQTNEIKAVAVGDPVWLTDGGNANEYGVCVTGVCCCTTNSGKGWPEMLRAAVAATADGAGVVVGVLVPTQSTVRLAGGAAVTVTVATDFPFSDAVSVSVSGAPATGPPLRLLLRVPTWATAASTLTVGGAPQNVGALAGSFAAVPLARGGASGAVLSVGTAIRVKVWPGANGGVSVHRGALLFSLRMDENATVTRAPWPAWPNATDLAVTSGSEWRYALVIADLADPGAAMTFTQHAPPGPVPFAPDAVPCSIRASARLVPSWTVDRDAAGQLPPSPVDCAAPGACGPVVDVTLVPHGSTLLRIATLPYTPA